MMMRFVALQESLVGPNRRFAAPQQDVGNCGVKRTFAPPVLPRLTSPGPAGVSPGLPGGPDRRRRARLSGALRTVRTLATRPVSFLSTAFHQG
jgi:hypothetical protein